MTSELFTIFANSKAASTSGTCSGATVTSSFMNLVSNIWTDSSGREAWTSGYAPTSIIIPKGTALKFWENQITVIEGKTAVNIDVSNNSGVTYRTLHTDYAVTLSGNIQNVQPGVVRSGRPLVIPSDDGNSRIRFVQVSDAATGGVFAEYNVEIVELNE